MEEQRTFPRYDVQCCARIRIGNRQYAGYLHNISQGGARLRTACRIRRLGEVVLRLPDLPPMRCQLRWTDAFNAGVSFSLVVPLPDLADWAEARRRLAVDHLPTGMAELMEVAT
jgi:hypothetical protein